MSHTLSPQRITITETESRPVSLLTILPLLLLLQLLLLLVAHEEDLASRNSTS